MLTCIVNNKGVGDNRSNARAKLIFHGTTLMLFQEIVIDIYDNNIISGNCNRSIHEYFCWLSHNFLVHFRCIYNYEKNDNYIPQIERLDKTLSSAHGIWRKMQNVKYLPYYNVHNMPPSTDSTMLIRRTLCDDRYKSVLFVVERMLLTWIQ